MKILGLSFGRKNRNSDILVKEALLGAKEAGAEIAFLNMMDKQIGHCTGCAAWTGAEKRAVHQGA